ncbi:MarR family winged helix-turn-helix transcriptional regulator [Streptomyces sp. ID05-18]|uniref:MarR family winged helix-turn-helix transcriptional regulator n=1 Tax=Streptomyces sp. ID05-18 TaxID=3028662 RepID=UPI0029AE95C6|nr:MarR family transcriptional regulator [Streptomyces sp. ID05-18]MDX3488227.1 MarR family transcriptional regulator [Streptomyces sp. ID05-18]
MNAPDAPVVPVDATAPVMPTSAIQPERVDIARWRQLNAAHGRIEDVLSRALAEVKLSVVEFTVLDVIHEQINGHLRMQDVAQVSGLTTGATTRLVNRLEGRDLLRRVLCDFDRRGIFSELTDAGRALVARARPLHDTALRTSLASPDNADAIVVAARALPQP